MILDEFGKPARRGPTSTLVAPQWLMEQTARIAVDWEVERRLWELHNSLAFARIVDQPLVGQTIKVRLPKRFAAPNPKASGA